MAQYQFIDEKNVEFRYDLSEVNPENIYCHFMSCNDEICYIFQGEFLYGIVTIGDLYRYFDSNEEFLLINQKYRSINERDYDMAEKIFERIPTIHEIPIVVEKKLIGVWRNGENTDIEWKQLRQRLEKSHSGVRRWYVEELSKWLITEGRERLSKINGKVFIYRIPSTDGVLNKLSREEKELWQIKKKYPAGPCGLPMMSETEQQGFWGSNYSEEWVEAFCRDYNLITGKVRNGVFKFDDLSSEHFNFKDGYRTVPNANKEAKRKVWIFGPCIAIGTYVSDSQTIQAYLQKMLLDNEYTEYEVVNCGMCGYEYMLGNLVTTAIADNDIVIIFYNTVSSETFGDLYKGDLSDIYFELERPIDNIFNGFAHCNYKVNKKIAERFFDDITPYLSRDNKPAVPRRALQDYYIPWEVQSYFKDYCANYQIIRNRGICGAIVMNCNPFTKGHRYLIEQAVKRVDLLYIFVVEEDKSSFSFMDRIEMVRRGTADFNQVKVLPSGKYIISKETFSQYFEKDNVEQVDDMDYDVRIFGEVVAKELGISVRFVGEEPFDKVTRKYNETMKLILPEYGIELIEIPRTMTEDGKIISASAVRKAMQDNNDEMLFAFLPNTTIEYLCGKKENK